MWKAAGEAHSYSQIVKLLMLTGTRRNEIAELCWSEIGADMIVIPGARTKNKKPLEIPLTPAMRAVIETLPRRANPDGSPRDRIFGAREENGFSSFSSSKRALDANIRANRIAADPNAAAMENWTLHDFRRSMSTTMNELGVEPHIVELCLNHLEGVKGGVAGVYNLARYREAKGRAWALWNDQLMNAVHGRTAKVVGLRRR
jgi:integrase